MITQQLANILPPVATNDGLATMKDVASVIVPSVIADNSVCVCKCAYRELVFSEVGAIVDWNKNDKTTLLFKKAITADTITIKLFKGTTPYTITNNTYGTYYNGTLTGQSLYWGFIADWNKIYNALGAGAYYFEITTIIIGVTTVTESIEYYLQPYSDLMADGTVRIETYNTGTILSSEFDYSGILQNGWYQSFRIKGMLSIIEIPKTIDNYYDQDNNLIQIQDKLSEVYELETGLLPFVIFKQLIMDNMLANKILISDYNVFNETVYRQVSLYNTVIDKKIFPNNTNRIFTLRFIPAKDNIIKNNY